ncbi:hypothetical protein STCU_12318 [Strigomonas culicis]|uniref:Uncharacterized protein n=1 Tax=Strigomonas culicis TaxID=28005 RepID=S9UXA0_9TRYP|nr:hypothetical protein STCU_12318 [Strigomonas culicis]|eukprot:EPY15145.1 hypothetical protein STCU_12318 [Strigomonas culicis]
MSDSASLQWMAARRLSYGGARPSLGEAAEMDSGLLVLTAPQRPTRLSWAPPAKRLPRLAGRGRGSGPAGGGDQDVAGRLSYASSSGRPSARRSVALRLRFSTSTTLTANTATHADAHLGSSGHASTTESSGTVWDSARRSGTCHAHPLRWSQDAYVLELPLSLTPSTRSEDAAQPSPLSSRTATSARERRSGTPPGALSLPRRSPSLPAPQWQADPGAARAAGTLHHNNKENADATPERLRPAAASAPRPCARSSKKQPEDASSHCAAWQGRREEEEAAGEGQEVSCALPLSTVV